MRRLTVLYDSTCGFCTWCRHWLERQAQLVPLEFVPARSTAVARRFPSLAGTGRPEELIVVDDEGGVYRDADAWVMCLYALADYREWSLRLAGPLWRPHAKAVFKWVSTRRTALSRWLRLQPEEPPATTDPGCSGDACERPGEPESEAAESERPAAGLVIWLFVGAVLGMGGLKPSTAGGSMGLMVVFTIILVVQGLTRSRPRRVLADLSLLWAGFAGAAILAAMSR